MFLLEEIRVSSGRNVVLLGNVFLLKEMCFFWKEYVFLLESMCFFWNQCVSSGGNVFLLEEMCFF